LRSSLRKRVGMWQLRTASQRTSTTAAIPGTRGTAGQAPNATPPSSSPLEIGSDRTLAVLCRAAFDRHRGRQLADLSGVGILNFSLNISRQNARALSTFAFLAPPRSLPVAGRGFFLPWDPGNFAGHEQAALSAGWVGSAKVMGVPRAECIRLLESVGRSLRNYSVSASVRALNCRSPRQRGQRPRTSRR
jgi:hypothetical protein